MTDAEITKNFKIINDRINEIYKRLDDNAAENKSILEDGIIELASIITGDQEVQ